MSGCDLGDFGFAAGVFGAAAGLGEIRVCVFQEWILVAMAQLLLKTEIAVMVMLVGFGCAFGTVGVVIGNLGQEAL
jgi:hypothetical protein